MHSSKFMKFHWTVKYCSKRRMPFSAMTERHFTCLVIFLSSKQSNNCHLLKVLKHNRCFLSNNTLKNTTSHTPVMFNSRAVNVRHSATLTPSQNISLSHVKRVLSANRMEFKDGYTCVTTNCISCNNSDKEGHLFINKITGYFFCGHCKACGPWDSLEKSLKNNKPYSHAKDIVQVPEKLMSICEKSKPFESLSLEKKADVIRLFSFKEGYEDLLTELGTLVNDDATLIYIPIKNGEHIVGVKELTPTGDTTVPALECKGLITIRGERKRKKKGEAEAVVVVHSVRDLLALGSARLATDVVCLPHGVSSLPQEALPQLERYARVVLWLGHGEGEGAPQAAARLARKLDDRRCHLIRLTEAGVGVAGGDVGGGADDALRRGEDLAAIVAERAVPVSHNAIVHFAQLRDSVLAELQNLDKAAGVKWGRFPALNTLLKGHRRGEMTVLTGPSGAGKTTFVSEYSLDLATQGVTTLWGSFEIKNERLARIMLQQYSRLPLDRSLDRFDHWADRFQALPIYYMTFHGQQPLRVVMDALEHAAYVYDVAHVVIDNVQFMMGHDQDSNSLDRFHRQDVIIGAFRRFATVADCHVTLVIHPRKEREGEPLGMSSVFGGVKATQEADNVLIIQHRLMPNLRVKKTLQVAKNRYSGDLGIMPLEFDKDALSFAQNKS